MKLQPYLEKTQQLLQSDDAYDLAVGIAAATGRRFSEVLARGHFCIPDEVSNPYQLLFEGQLKTDNPQPYLVYSVVTAQEVVEAIARLRNHPKVAPLNSSDEDEATIKQVNALNSAINGRCQRHYEKSQIVRPLPIDQHISMHSLRRAYAAIMLRIATANATHLHRPPNVDPLQFAAQNLGHQANGNATKHYLCYYVVDEGETDSLTQTDAQSLVAAVNGGESETVTAVVTDKGETDTQTDQTWETQTQLATQAPLSEESVETDAQTETISDSSMDECETDSLSQTDAESLAAVKDAETDTPTDTARETQTQLARQAPVEVGTEALSEDASQTSTEVIPQEISIAISGSYQQQLSEIGSRLGLPQTDTKPLFEALMDLLTLKLDTIASVVCGVSEPIGVQQQIDQLKAMQLQLQQQVWMLQSNSEAGDRPVSFPKRRGRSANPVDFSEMSSQKLKKSTRKGSATEKLRRALKALQEHNDRAVTRSQKWHINLSTLKNLTGCFVPSIRSFMDDYAAEIAKHNQIHDLDEGVNKAHGQMGEKVEHFIEW